VEHTATFTVSQPAYLNDFQTLGFNEDEAGARRHLVLGGGRRRPELQVRAARAHRANRQNHLYPEANFPFAYPSLTDR
jgi:hypothetical protein